MFYNRPLFETLTFNNTEENMSAIIIDEMTDTIRSKKLVQKRNLERAPSFIDKLNLKGKYDNHKLAKIWAWRNHDHGEVFASSLEIDYLLFDQNILVEETTDLVAKLTRIGFVEQVGFPDEELFKDFSYVMYNKKHNIAITLYQPTLKTAIKTAHAIMEKSKFGGSSGMAVFLAAVEVLIKK